MSHERTPSPDPDGVRVIRERAPLPKAALLAFPVIAFALVVVFFPRSTPPLPVAEPASIRSTAADTLPAPSSASPEVTATPPTTIAPLAQQPVATAATPAPPDSRPSAEDNDIARHFRPGDEAPSAAELIQALRDAGETGGIAAFNPPGTSPPLTGIAVPADFPLPPGYVRHHQWTDEGEPVEAILMFAPDFVLRDAEGREIPLPENRVVPPELAPPGLPIRPVEIPGE